MLKTRKVLAPCGMMRKGTVIKMKKSATLVIMDGYGLAPPSAGNAVESAVTPILDKLFASYPNTTLIASGEDVGLPAGQIGNSEVGHTNIGAGRVVYQELPKISRDIESGVFFANEALLKAVDACKSTGGALHLLGLLSPGGVHSHTDHLFALIKLAKNNGLKKVFIHCFMDGRDVAPDSGIESVKALLNKCDEIGVGKIATVIGRFYAMDRDERWDRLEIAYNTMVFGEAPFDPDPVHVVQMSYNDGVYDEFIKPVVCDRDGLIKPDDSIIFFNFRPDRAREITWAFVNNDFEGFVRKNGFFPLTYVCMAQYDEKLQNLPIAYGQEIPEHTIGEHVSNLGLKQLRIAETEKYAHVTFFFNGGLEKPFEGEERILIPSPKEFLTYDLIPEMSAYKVAEAACSEIESGKYDIVIINFANCDMVGHTGIYAAAVKAVETVDECVGMVWEAVKNVEGILVVTADHGNAEEMLAPDGIHPQTAHSINAVPMIVAGSEISMLKSGRLADISPTLLDLLGLDKPDEMTGNSLIVK